MLTCRIRGRSGIQIIKCKVIYVRKGKQVEHAANLKLDETTLVEKLKTGTKYKFLSVRESGMDDEKLAFTVAAKTYLQRLSIIWTSPLSDANRVKQQTSSPCLS